MQLDVSLQWPPTIDTVVGITLSLTIVFFLIRGVPAESSLRTAPSARGVASQAVTRVPSTASVEVHSPTPIRLIIPKIGVDAPLESVGLTASGEAGVPEDPSDAAWLNAGPRPGEEGTAVIDGHYGWKDGIPAVFDDLTKLQKGDRVYVEDQQGTVTTFVVRGIQTYGEHDNVSDVFVSSDKQSHLNLITCEGVWNKVSQSYSDRLVVFADKMQ